MSILECPDLQIWNNAAFDNGESEDSVAAAVAAAANKSSWSNFQHMNVNLSESFESDSSKENQSPAMAKSSSVSVKSPMPIKPLHPKNSIENSQLKQPNKIVSKQGLVVTPLVVSKRGNEEEVRDEVKIDSEIQEIEMEISRLSLRLEALRIEKSERNAKTVERRGRIVPAKFMDPKQSGKNLGLLKKIDEPLSLSAMSKLQRRGVSMGPSEIIAGSRYRQLGKPEITPVQSIQNRRKSCFWKLHDIDELKVTKERGGKCSSLSPKSRKTASKIQVPKQAATTVGSKKLVKKEDAILSSIQPKKLFNGEKSVPAKKPLKPGRVVASRYNSSTSKSNEFSALRKRSLPDDDKDDGKRIDKKRASLAGKSRGNAFELCPIQGMESRVKKRWEIPNEIVICKGVVGGDFPSPAVNNTDILPRIRTARCVNETPRDSGAAKRVAELVGKKSYFGADEAGEPSFCQALSFAEEDEEE